MVPWQLYAIAAMLLVAAENNYTRINPMTLPRFLFVTIAMAIPQILFFWRAMQLAPKLLSAWYFYMSISVFMSIISTIFIVRENPGAIRWIGAGLVIAGAWLLR